MSLWTAFNQWIARRRHRHVWVRFGTAPNGWYKERCLCGWKRLTIPKEWLDDGPPWPTVGSIPFPDGGYERPLWPSAQSSPPWPAMAPAVPVTVQSVPQPPPQPPPLRVPDVERQPSAIAEAVREQAGGDSRLASHLWSYALRLKREGNSAEEVVAALGNWQSTEPDTPLSHHE